MENRPITVNELKTMTHTRELLITYVGMHYEENSDFSDESLVAEYNLLARNNQLEELFQCEIVANLGRLEGEQG